MKSMNFKKGFTLIELLIVIAIIAVLAVAFLPSLLGAPAKARDTQRVAQTQKIAGWLTVRSLGGTAMPVTGCITSGAGTVIGALITANVSDFGGTFPKDPNNLVVTGGGTTTACPAGDYGYVKFATGSFSSGVYAAAEILSNANVACASIDPSQAAPALIQGAVATAPGCILALIQ